MFYMIRLSLSSSPQLPQQCLSLGNDRGKNVSKSMQGYLRPWYYCCIVLTNESSKAILGNKYIHT